MRGGGGDTAADDDDDDDDDDGWRTGRRIKKPMWSGRVYFTTCLFNSISYASAVMTSSCRNRLLLMSADVPTSVQYLTSTMAIDVSDRLPVPRLSVRLGLLRAESVLLTTTHVPSRTHILLQCPHVQNVGIVPYYRSIRLFAQYLGDTLLMLSVKYDGWTTDDVVFDKLVQTDRQTDRQRELFY